MNVRISVSGPAAEAVRRLVPQLVADDVASRITALDASLWGPEAEPEASKRLGWTEAVAISRPLLPEIAALRDQLRADGVDHIVLAGMGGSSLAPEVITRTARAHLTVLDSTDFETDEGGWAVTPPPPGSDELARNWTRRGQEFEEGGVVTTDDTVYTGFGFEGLSTESRGDFMERALQHLGVIGG